MIPHNRIKTHTPNLWDECAPVARVALSKFVVANKVMAPNKCEVSKDNCSCNVNSSFIEKQLTSWPFGWPTLFYLLPLNRRLCGSRRGL
jgi:hypothetical protein